MVHDRQFNEQFCTCTCVLTPLGNIHCKMHVLPARLAWRLEGEFASVL